MSLLPLKALPRSREVVRKFEGALDEAEYIAEYARNGILGLIDRSPFSSRPQCEI